MSSIYSETDESADDPNYPDPSISSLIVDSSSDVSDYEDSSPCKGNTNIPVASNQVDPMSRQNIQRGKRHGPSPPPLFTSKSVTVQKMTSIGINILMGITPLPSYRDYWSSAPDLLDSYISNVMTVKRIDWFLSHLHLNDESKMPTRDSSSFDKLYKVRPLLSSKPVRISKMPFLQMKKLLLTSQ